MVDLGPRAAELLGDAIAATLDRGTPRLEAFLSARSQGQALRVWLDLPADLPAPERADLLARLARDVAALDELINTQLNAVLHHPRFQQLEAAWRGLAWLVEGLPAGQEIKVRVLGLSFEELARDLERAIEFDQSQLFRKIYSAEFGHPGGEPYGVLLGDYHVAHGVRPGSKVNDLRVLRGMAQVAAAAFAPFVAGAHPSLFGLETFGELERFLDLPRTLRGAEYVAWTSLRQSEDTRFMALTLPRMLMRKPWAYDVRRRDGFAFEEVCTRHEDFLWGNACFAFGRVLIRAFERSSWPAQIRGVERGVEGGGLVSGLPAPDFGTDRPGVARRSSLEVMISDRLERTLSDLGFMPLCHCPGTELAAFYGTPSLHLPATYSSAEAQVNAKLSAMLQYVLCASRIAHYIKVICRDRTGSYTSAQQLEQLLSRWLLKLTTSTEDADPDLQARFPLRDSSVSLREVPGKPGCFHSVILLNPHFQLDHMTSSIRLVTEIVTGR